MASKFHLYAIGQVVEDYKEDDNRIKINPKEILSSNTGDLSENNMVVNSTKNANNEYNTSAVNRNMIITAKWMNTPNRLTAPSVCKGELVRLYRYGNTDDFYWSTYKNQIGLRKNEKAVWGWSNKKSIEEDSDTSSIYSFTVDTINKFVGLITPKNDGEVTDYEISLDTGNGVLKIEDGLENSIILTSDAGDLSLKINTSVNVTTTTATVNAGLVVVNAGAIVFNAGTYTVNSGITHINP